MEGLQIFNSEEFGQIRTIEENGKIMFCGNDVAAALGYADTPKAIKTHCKSGGWAICPVTDNLGRTQQAKFIDEGNLYRLITHSKLGSAERFESWVFDEVLPSLRKTGSYEMPSQNADRPACIEDVLIQSLQEMKDIRAKVDKQSIEMKAVKDAMTAPAVEEKFSEWVSRTIGNIASSPEYADNPFRYQSAWGESYKRLQDKASCRLDVLLKNAKKRAEENGASKSKVKAISKLSVIEADKRLKALYIGVLQEMSVAYCVEVV